MSDTTLPSRLLTVRETAARLSLSEQAVYRRVRESRLPVVRLGPATLRVDERELEAWIEEKRA